MGIGEDGVRRKGVAGRTKGKRACSTSWQNGRTKPRKLKTGFVHGVTKKPIYLFLRVERANSFRLRELVDISIDLLKGRGPRKQHIKLISVFGEGSIQETGRPSLKGMVDFYRDLGWTGLREKMLLVGKKKVRR